MKENKFSLKKQPLQERAQFTVEAIVEAGAQVLCSEGYKGFTTNKAAERAGVSIGSLYQYFQSKEVLLAEIKRRHFEQLRACFQRAYVTTSGEPFEIRVRAFIEASVEAHQLDPDLHRVLSDELSEFEVKEDDRSANSVRVMIEQVLREHHADLRSGLDIALAARLSYVVVEELIHDAVVNEKLAPAGEHFVDELVLLLLAYFRTGSSETADIQTRVLS